jgi:hypothetical protein
MKKCILIIAIIGAFFAIPAQQPRAVGPVESVEIHSDESLDNDRNSVFIKIKGDALYYYADATTQYGLTMMALAESAMKSNQQVTLIYSANVMGPPTDPIYHKILELYVKNQ